MLRYRERRVRGALARHVECVWAVWDPSPARAAREPERIVPDGCPELIVHLGDPFARRHGGRWRRQPRSFVAGTLTQPWLLRAGARVATVGLRFRPAGLPALLGGSLDGTADREVRVERWIGRAAARELTERLVGARSIDERLERAEEWLAARPTAPAAAVPAVDIVLEERGRIAVAELARRLGWDRRRLERTFLRDLGVGPKLFARIVRLNVVLAALDGAERARAVDIALDAGYFDQAHLLRDFRMLAGRPPRPRREDGELAQHFTTEERLRVLLGG